jgi:hypothetical protein
VPVSSEQQDFVPAQRALTLPNGDSTAFKFVSLVKPDPGTPLGICIARKAENERDIGFVIRKIIPGGIADR